MTELKDFKALKITLASPDDVKQWSFGEITKPETINYRTLKPEKDGLFDERIFGPVRDFECYCGKYKRIRYKGVICDKCGVEVTHSKVRRERMAHLSLAAPVAHVWFFRGAPSKLSLLLDISPRNLESVIYFAQYLIEEVDEDERDRVMNELHTKLAEKKLELQQQTDVRIGEIEAALQEKAGQDKAGSTTKKEAGEIRKQERQLDAKKQVATLRDELAKEQALLDKSFHELEDKIKSLKPLDLLSENDYAELVFWEADEVVKVGMGAEALMRALEKVDLDALAQELKAETKSPSLAKRTKATKRLRVAEGLKMARIQPVWMIMTVLPVIPPDLRPMVQLSGGRFATSDLNDLYRRVINRNNRLKRLMDLGAPEIILRNEKRMLQEAVDALIDSSQREKRAATRRAAQKMRSLSEMLKGKQGRFRQNLLGKRVDYSGRSVIVVGPELRLDQCGLPKEMALQLFKPFVLRELIAQGFAPNVKSAKNVLERRGTEVWDILEEVTVEHPILLNRAPTLHRLGIQAFYPVLIEGNAIKLHPAVCNAFNADFDGDMMAVHVPLSSKSIEEARSLMLSPHNMLKLSDGQPVIDMKNEFAIGLYYLTVENPKAKGSGRTYLSADEAILAEQNGVVHIQAPVEVYMDGDKVTTTVGRLYLNEVLPEVLRYHNKPVDRSGMRGLLARAFETCGVDEAVRLVDSFKELGRHYSTSAGTSFSITDFPTPASRKDMLAKANDELDAIEKNYRRGLTTARERRSLIIDLWTRVNDAVGAEAIKQVDPYSIISLIVASKSGRANRGTLTQLGGMRGLMVDSMGQTIETPIKTNIIEGSTSFDGFIGARSARKGLIDTALMTAEAGYLTRRLVDVAHDVIIRTEDCGTTDGLAIRREDGAWDGRLLGRVTAAVATNAAGDPVLEANHEISDADLETLAKEQVDSVVIRTALTCQSRHGICAMCYGRDLASRKMVAMGTAVGVIAAQSIGEPGTQLTMQTFHKGGVAGKDITQGLPRVEELFEARTPKDSAILSEISGTVSIERDDLKATVTVESVETLSEEIVLRAGEKALVAHNDKVAKGQPIIKPASGAEIKARDIAKVKVKADGEVTTMTLQYELRDARTHAIRPGISIIVNDGDMVNVGQPITEGHFDLREMLAIRGMKAVQAYILSAVQSVYESQGIEINDKHIEIIIRKMFDKVRILASGDSSMMPGDLVEKIKFEEENARILAEGGEISAAEVTILGITRSSLLTDSWLSAASFQETTSVLTDAATKGKVDRLLGLKENVIIGRLIPTGDSARIE
jgi:DNA-directed RNA polymerase subunit beta'